MKNRMYPFGYNCENGEIKVNEYEAAVVRMIFSEYDRGGSLKQIVSILNKGAISFNSDGSLWDKCKLHRLLMDTRYVGDKLYPPIIEIDLFDRVNSARESKYVEVTPASDEIKFLQNKITCSKCDSHYIHEINKKGEHYWTCAHSCCRVKPTDGYILSSIYSVMGKVVRDRNLLNNSVTTTCYSPTPDIVRMNNEFRRVEHQCGYEVAKTLLFQIASAKFSICKEDKSIYTNNLYEKIRASHKSGKLNVQQLKDIVKEVRINERGRVAVVFTNDAIVAGKEELYAGKVGN